MSFGPLLSTTWTAPTSHQFDTGRVPVSTNTASDIFSIPTGAYQIHTPPPSGCILVSLWSLAAPLLRPAGPRPNFRCSAFRGFFCASWCTTNPFCSLISDLYYLCLQILALRPHSWNYTTTFTADRASISRSIPPTQRERQRRDVVGRPSYKTQRRADEQKTNAPEIYGGCHGRRGSPRNKKATNAS